MRRALVFVSLLLAAACDQNVSNEYYEVAIVDPAGAFPTDRGEITVRVKQDGALLDCDGNPCSAEIDDGAFSLDLPLGTPFGMTEIQVVIEDEGERWIGASPPFRPYGGGADVTGRVRVVVGHPSSCAPLALDGLFFGDPPRLDPPRAHPAAVVRRNIVLLVGGEELDGGADGHVARFDQLSFDTVLDDGLEDPLGAARGLSVSEDVSLVLGDRAFLFELDPNGPPTPRAVQLHEGAGFDSALVPLGADGGAVVGGEGVTWISAGGVLTMSSLAVSRGAPAAASLGEEGLLVVGGHAEGEASAEWVPRSGDGEPLALEALPLASGGVLLPSPDGRDALWIGYDVGGAISGDTWIIRGCPDACTVEEGPPWDRARAGVAAVITEGGALWLAGGDTDEVDVVRWAGDRPEIEAGPALPAERTDAALFEHASGVVALAGGRQMRGELVMCFPPALDSL